MLHLVNKSPFERNGLETCLKLAKKGTPILLLEDGVYAATKNTKVTDQVASAMKEHKVYAIGADLKARAIAEDRIIDGVEIVDYGTFVDLVVEHGPTQSWL